MIRVRHHQDGVHRIPAGIGAGSDDVVIRHAVHRQLLVRQLAQMQQRLVHPLQVPARQVVHGWGDERCRTVRFLATRAHPTESK